MIYTPDNFISAFMYIASTPYFWQSMGMITAISMIITVTLYDHQYGLIARSAFAVISFAFILFLVTLFRIDNVQSTHGVTSITNAFAGLVTIAIVGFFWVLGIGFGSLLVWLQKRKYKPYTKKVLRLL